MPYLSTPQIWMPEVTPAQEKVLRAIYAKVDACKSTPSDKFLNENPDYY